MPMSKEDGERLWKARWESWIERAKAKHDGKYLYPSPEKRGNKIVIICPEHGEFLQIPAKHMYGAGCPRCAGLGGDKLAPLRERFPDWDWTGVMVEKTKQELHLNCPEHGVFKTTQNRLLTITSGKTPCPACNKIASGLSQRVSVDTWVKRVEDRWGNRIVLDPASVGRCQEKATFTCAEHGEFQSILIDVSNGHGCPQCGQERFNQWTADNVKVSAEEFHRRAIEVNGDRYQYDLSTFTDMVTPMRMVCAEHGEFWQIPRNHTWLLANCPRCAGYGPSKGEAEVADYIESLGFTVDRNARILDGKEVDVLVRELNLGIEYCGLYWHGEGSKERNYHKDKYVLARGKGVKLLTVFEDEWLENPGKVKAKILNELGACERIYARATAAEKISWSEAEAFLGEHHLQSSGKPAATCYALKQGGEIVAVCTWGRDRFSESGALELYRFCSKTGLVVVGGLSKLIKHTLRCNPTETTLVTYADLRWGSGEGYGKAGFTKTGETQPGYFWCKGLSRLGRHLFQKHKLKDRLKVFDETLSEIENCKANGYWRIYDCGHSKWVLKR